MNNEYMGEIARAKSSGDQAWKEAEVYFEDIQRLALVGDPDCDRDRLIIRATLCLVAGEIYARRAEREVMNTDMGES